MLFVAVVALQENVEDIGLSFLNFQERSATLLVSCC